MFKYTVSGVLFALVTGFSTMSMGEGQPNKVWSDADSVVEDIVDLRSEHGFKPVSQISDVDRRKLESLIIKTVNILAGAEGLADRKQLEAINQEILNIQKEIADLRFQRAAAPEKTDDMLEKAISYTPFGKKTKDDIDRSIAELEQEIVDLQDKTEIVKRNFASSLEKYGITLTQEQLDGLLSVVTADDMLDMQTVFVQMRAINEMLRQATIDQDESPETARRYYGVYTVMIEVALFMHSDFIAKVDELYMKELMRIKTDAASLKQQASKMVKNEKDSALRKILKKNIEAHELTMEVGNIYQEHLEKQVMSVKKSRRLLKNRHKVAVNTYKTMQVSSDLISLLRTTDEAFEALLSLDIPELRPIESIELKNEFDRLSKEMKDAIG